MILHPINILLCHIDVFEYLYCNYILALFNINAFLQPELVQRF